MSTLHDLFQEQVRLRPTAVAVSAGPARLTYGELAEMAGSLAEDLVRAGVVPGDRVAVRPARSPAYVAAVLGVLGAGAVYVPIDPDYPRLRQEFLLSDAGATAVVVHEGAEGGHASPTVDIAALPPTRSAPPPVTPRPVPPRVAADSLAYVMYTSGSTGLPKGVAVEHRQVVSLVMDDERLRVRPGDRVAMLASTSFDASTFEIWAALCRGAELLLPQAGTESVDRFRSVLEAETPDWLFLTTGLFHLIADHDPDAFASVGTLITGGDVLSPRHLVAAASRVRGAVYAAYGPTEATTFTTLHRVDPRSPLDTAPIGTPLRGRSVLLLDPALRPVPEGEIGEIVIGGSGVARGYLGRPEQTAERFVRIGGQRCYRTGDLGRMRPDGSLEFHGRTDRQLKIRGFRIEPGEIESRLNLHPSIASSAVTGVEDSRGAKRLVAYVVAAKGTLPAPDEVRTWLRDALPPHMEPASIVFLEDMPLDAHGKPDRTRLPYPFTRRADLADLPPYRAPRTEQEMKIVNALAEALDLDTVGMDDDFYALGGDSLRSIDVLARLRGAGLDLAARDLFTRPSAAGLASSLVL